MRNVYERQVAGKAEYMPGKADLRFSVTSLSSDEVGAHNFYKVPYRAHSEMENRIKEQQLGMSAGRTSTTIRLKLLKNGAHLRLTVRKIWLSF